MNEETKAELIKKLRLLTMKNTNVVVYLSGGEVEIKIQDAKIDYTKIDMVGVFDSTILDCEFIEEVEFARSRAGY